MALEQLANNPQDSLSSPVDGVTNPVTLTVNDASEFPATGNFRILIDSEILLVTAVSGNDFTATRAQEGTSIAAHLAAAAVTGVLTAAAVKQHTAEFHGYDTFANRPTAGQANRLFIASDGNTLFRDTGSVWQSLGPVYGPFTAPDVANFATAVNILATGSVANSKGTIEFFDVATGAAADSIQMRLAAVPVGNWTMTAAFAVRTGFGNGGHAGIAIRNSTNGRVTVFGPNYRASDTANKLTIYNYTSPTAFSSSSLSTWMATSQLYFLRLSYDGTNLVYYVSQDFINWNLVASTGLVGSHTGAGSDGIGFFINANANGTGQTYGAIFYHAVLG